jgi:xanthine dehydrogenase iron-sulfur cluster and FAD-binding subunit A
MLWSSCQNEHNGLLTRNPNPSEHEVLEALRYNLCRCGAHIEIIRAAMRAGYREFVVLPDDAEMLRQAVHEAIYQEGGDEDHGEVVTIWGSKGGAGSTFLAVNLAAVALVERPYLGAR